MSWEGCGMKQICPPQTMCHESQLPGQESNLGPPKYKQDVTTQLEHTCSTTKSAFCDGTAFLN